MIAGNKAAGARHVCHRDRRITGDELAEIAGENPRINVGAAARRKADDDSHDFAAIVIRYSALIAICAWALRRRCRKRRAGKQDKNQRGYRNTQVFTPPRGNLAQVPRRAHSLAESVRGACNANKH
jgi:hypothetical protein